MDYQGSAMDLSEDFTVAASNVITTLAFGKEVSVFLPQLSLFLWLSEMDSLLPFCIGNGTRSLFMLPFLALYISAFIMCYSATGQCISLVGYVKI